MKFRFYGFSLFAAFPDFSEVGPILFSKILNLNDIQSGIIAVVFKYCDDNDIPIVDLKDIKKVLQYVSNDGKKEFEVEYGKISSVSLGTILRKIIELEQHITRAPYRRPS